MARQRKVKWHNVRFTLFVLSLCFTIMQAGFLFIGLAFNIQGVDSIRAAGISLLVQLGIFFVIGELGFKK